MMLGRVWQQVDLLLLGRLLVAFALVQNLFWLADDLQHARETERARARRVRVRGPASGVAPPPPRERRESSASERPRGDADGDGGITWQNW